MEWTTEDWCLLVCVSGRYHRIGVIDRVTIHVNNNLIPGARELFDEIICAYAETRKMKKAFFVLNKMEERGKLNQDFGKLLVPVSANLKLKHNLCHFGYISILLVWFHLLQGWSHPNALFNPYCFPLNRWVTMNEPFK